MAENKTAGPAGTIDLSWLVKLIQWLLSMLQTTQSKAKTAGCPDHDARMLEAVNDALNIAYLCANCCCCPEPDPAPQAAPPKK